MGQGGDGEGHGLFAEIPRLIFGLTYLDLHRASLERLPARVHTQHDDRWSTEFISYACDTYELVFVCNSEQQSDIDEGTSLLAFAWHSTRLDLLEKRPRLSMELHAQIRMEMDCEPVSLYCFRPPLIMWQSVELVPVSPRVLQGSTNFSHNRRLCG